MSIFKDKILLITGGTGSFGFVLLQYRFVKDRVMEILGSDLYGQYVVRYLKNSSINATDHRDGVKKILRMLKDEPMTFNGKPIKGIFDYQKISFNREFFMPHGVSVHMAIIFLHSLVTVHHSRLTFIGIGSLSLH